MSDMLSGQRVITSKTDLCWLYDGTGFNLDDETEEPSRLHEYFDASEWTVEIVLTPKFKPGYFREKGCLHSAAVWFDKEVSDMEKTLQRVEVISVS